MTKLVISIKIIDKVHICLGASTKDELKQKQKRVKQVSKCWGGHQERQM